MTIVGLSIFMTLAFLMTIAALLRQLNKEREERFTLMQHYANLALRVRWMQSVEEHPMADRADYPEAPWAQQASVHDVEGTL